MRVLIFTFLCSFPFFCSLSQNNAIAISGGIGNTLNFETISATKTTASTCMFYSRLFNTTNPNLIPITKFRVNISSIKQELSNNEFNEPDRFTTRLAFTDVLGGMRLKLGNTGYTHLLVGPSLTMSAAEQNSDINYLRADVIQQVSLKANLGFGIDVSDSVGFSIEETINVTNLQKPYLSVDRTGNLFERDGGLQFLTSELNLYFKF